jgi:GntR family transcriptional regulator
VNIMAGSVILTRRRQSGLIDEAKLLHGPAARAGRLMDGGLSKVAATRDRLLRLVQSLEAGTALPAERDLAARWGVARMTLRRATDELVQAGLVRRQHGRGTFVLRPKLPQRLAMTSFTSAMGEQGVEPGSRVLDFRVLRAGGRHFRSLRIPAGDAVVRFTRARLADGEPIGLETTWIAASRVPGLTAADLTGSWYELLQRRYGIHVATGTSVIDIAYASGRDAAQLACPSGSALLRVQTTSYDPTGHVADFGIDQFRGDAYALVTERKRGTAIRVR